MEVSGILFCLWGESKEMVNLVEGKSICNHILFACYMTQLNIKIVASSGGGDDADGSGASVFGIHPVSCVRDSCFARTNLS